MPNEYDLRRIAGESLCDIRTVRKVYQGVTVRQTCVVRVVAAAAAKLDVALPACAGAVRGVWSGA